MSVIRHLMREGEQTAAAIAKALALPLDRVYGELIAAEACGLVRVVVYAHVRRTWEFAHDLLEVAA